ncbi:MAG TPA: phosphatidylserine decarboxylase [Candidatus Acidoferrales bacterium]
MSWPAMLLAGASLALHWYLAAAGLLLLVAFVFYFFRDPERTIPQETGGIVSPADGRVVEIADSAWNGQPRKRISIFLSVFDVHVNRSPVEGVIVSADYRKGQFRAAWHAEASTVNEQNVVVVRGHQSEVVFKQIAGIIARRILFWRKPGDLVQRGERVGMIRFGSRVDVILDPACDILVRRGEHVKGGSSLLARAPVGSGRAK